MYFDCVSVAFVIQHSMRVHHVVICGLPHSTILSHKWDNLKIKFIEHKMRVLISSTTFV